MKVIRRIFIQPDGLLALTIDLDGQLEFNKITYPDTRLEEMAKHLGKGLFVMPPRTKKSDWDKLEGAGKKIVSKLSDHDVKNMYEILKKSDANIINSIIKFCYGSVGIAENELAIILRTILSNYFGYYIIKFAENDKISLKKSVKEIQEKVDSVTNRLENISKIRRRNNGPIDGGDATENK